MCATSASVLLHEAPAPRARLHVKGSSTSTLSASVRMNVLTICNPNEEMAIIEARELTGVRSKPWHRTSVVSWSSRF